MTPSYWDASCIPPVYSVLLVFGILLGIPLVIGIHSLTMFVRLRSKAKNWEAHPFPEPVTDKNVILRGIVQARPEEPTVVSVKIEEVGKELGRTKQRKYIKWTEESRVVKAIPFSIKIHDSLLTVALSETGSNIQIVDELEKEPSTNPLRRSSVCGLKNNDQVYVYGRLCAPSTARDNLPKTNDRQAVAKTWELKAPVDGKLLLSTKPLTNRYHLAARFYLPFIKYSCAGLLLFTVLQVTYFVRLFCAKTESMTIVSKDIARHRDAKGHVSYDHIVFLKNPRISKVNLKREVPSDLHSSLQTGSDIPVLYVEGWPAITQIGESAGASKNVTILEIVLLILGIIIRVANRFSNVVWYEQDSLESTEISDI
jgi:hypothetical protein